MEIASRYGCLGCCIDLRPILPEQKLPPAGTRRHDGLSLARDEGFSERTIPLQAVAELQIAEDSFQRY